MGKKFSCVEPKIGRRIQEYDDDAARPADEKKLALEEFFMFALHLIRCRYCRKKLSFEGQSEFKNQLVMAGYFVDDPILAAERMKQESRLFQNEMTDEEFMEDWLKIPRQEWRKLRGLFEDDD